MDSHSYHISILNILKQFHHEVMGDNPVLGSDPRSFPDAVVDMNDFHRVNRPVTGGLREIGHNFSKQCADPTDRQYGLLDRNNDVMMVLAQGQADYKARHSWGSMCVAFGTLGMIKMPRKPALAQQVLEDRR
jgi:hypothetical protein